MLSTRPARTRPRPQGRPVSWSAGHPGGEMGETDTAQNTRETPSPEHLRELTRLINGYTVSQAIYVMAKLGIADLLHGAPSGVDELAQATQAHAPSLFRLLRVLAGVGLVEEVAPRRFALTALGAGLRTDVP